MSGHDNVEGSLMEQSVEGGLRAYVETHGRQPT